MEDSGIVDLFEARQEQAIKETENKYGRLLMSVARNILFDEEDARENVNDTLLKTWHSIPPHKPAYFKAYLVKIDRFLAIDRLRARDAAKRIPVNAISPWDEFSDFGNTDSEGEQIFHAKELGQSISRFLWKQKKDVRQIFICRYFYGDSIEKIAKAMNKTPSGIKSILFRTRSKLKKHLQREGYEI